MKLASYILICVLAFCQVQSQNPKVIGTTSPTAVKNTVVFFSKTSKDTPICTGAVILYKWILTAASCVKKLSPTKIRFKVGIDAIIHVNTTSSGANIPHYDEAELIDRIIAHPGYSEGNLGNDIALISTLYPLHRDTEPYEIAKTNENWIGKTFVMKGFGSAIDLQYQYGDLKINEVTVIAQQISECRKEISNVPGNKLCSLGVRVCWGDQGGPLILQSTGELVGIISTPIGLQLSCGISVRPLETYTNIVLFRQWIMQTTGSNI